MAHGIGRMLSAGGRVAVRGPYLELGDNLQGPNDPAPEVLCDRPLDQILPARNPAAHVEVMGFRPVDFVDPAAADDLIRARA